MHQASELLQQIAAGDQQAFSSFYQGYYKKVMATAFHYLQQQEEAEEAVQDVFVAIYRAAHRYSPLAAPDTWIYRITVNQCLDRLRYRKARSYIRTVTALWASQTDKEPVATTADKPEEEIALSLLYKGINQLPLRQRTALILTQLQELSIREAAVVMDTSAKAVESLTMRAKANLKKYMIPGYK